MAEVPAIHPQFEFIAENGDPTLAAIFSEWLLSETGYIVYTDPSFLEEPSGNIMAMIGAFVQDPSKGIEGMRVRSAIWDTGPEPEELAKHYDQTVSPWRVGLDKNNPMLERAVRDLQNEALRILNLHRLRLMAGFVLSQAGSEYKSAYVLPAPIFRELPLVLRDDVVKMLGIAKKIMAEQKNILQSLQEVTQPFLSQSSGSEFIGHVITSSFLPDIKELRQKLGIGEPSPLSSLLGVPPPPRNRAEKRRNRRKN